MPSNTPISAPVPTFRAHLWSHALSSMILPEEAIALHSFLELPTTTKGTPSFVANWKFVLLRPVICNLIASLSDDYDTPPPQGCHRTHCAHH
jgi:hypothetical protein